MTSEFHGPVELTGAVPVGSSAVLTPMVYIPKRKQLFEQAGNSAAKHAHKQTEHQKEREGVETGDEAKHRTGVMRRIGRPQEQAPPEPGPKDVSKNESQAPIVALKVSEYSRYEPYRI